MNKDKHIDYDERMAQMLPSVPEEVKEKLLDAVRLNEYFRQAGLEMEKRGA